MSDWVKRVFTNQELISVEHGSLTFYMANELKLMGAPISFNPLNIYLSPEDIEICGRLKDRIRSDGSHEFVFKKQENEE